MRLAQGRAGDGGGYIAKHGLTPDVADEAFADPNRLVIGPTPPDPPSVSGRTLRNIGWSAASKALCHGDRPSR